MPPKNRLQELFDASGAGNDPKPVVDRTTQKPDTSVEDFKRNRLRALVQQQLANEARAMQRPLSAMEIISQSPAGNAVVDAGFGALAEGHTALEKVFDFISRGQYASAKFADVLAKEGIDSWVKALNAGFQEALHPSDRLSYRDVIKHNKLARGAKPQPADDLIGFAADIALDPLSWLTFGTGKSVQIVGKGKRVALSASGEKVRRILVEEAIKKPRLETITLEGITSKPISFTPKTEFIEPTRLRVDGKLLKEKIGGKMMDAQTARNRPAMVVDSGNAPIESLRKGNVSEVLAEPKANRSPIRIREQVDDLIVDLAGTHLELLTSPGIGVKFPMFKTQGTGISPVTVKSKNVITVRGMNALANKMGLDATRDIFLQTKFGQFVRQSWEKSAPTRTAAARILNRDAGLPDEYIGLRKQYEAVENQIEERVIDSAKELFFGLDKKAREKIGRVAARISDESNRAARLAKRNLTPRELSALRGRVLIGEDLSKRELQAYARFSQDYKELGELEQAAGLLTYLGQNYSPRLYKHMKDSDAFILYQKHARNRMSTFLSAEEKRAFLDIDDARAAGFAPEFDAAILYTARKIAGQKALANRMFNDNVEVLFGGKSKIPRFVQEDIRFMGDGIYPPGMSSASRAIAKFYDRSLKIFKTTATVARPSFGQRQIVSNFLQNYLESGTKAFGVFDPRSMTDAALLMQGKPAKFGITSALGDHYNGDELLQLVHENDVLRGTSLGGIEKTKRRIDKELRAQNIALKLTGNNEAAAGKALFARGMANYLQWPSVVEDFSRLQMFINGLRIGHSPKAALSITDNALFNYTQGLSEIEARWIRRGVPFYSYQRFAIPLVARSIVQNPGRAALFAKTKGAAESFWEAWNKREGGDRLSPAEQNVIPGYLLEQPAYFQEFDPELQAVFRTFNNFTPFDIMGGVGLDEKGNFDPKETILRGALSQLAPLLKMPFEYALKQEFFTGRSLEKERRLGDVDPDAFIKNTTTAMGAAYGGAFFAGIGRLVGVAANEMTSDETKEDILKRALGWQDGRDPDTGERTVFINPYTAWAISNTFPLFSEVVRQSRTHEPMFDRWLSLMGGIQTFRVDLNKSQRFKLIQRRKEFDELRAKLRRSLRFELPDSADQAEQDLDELLLLMREDDFIRRSNPPVRGQQ